MTPAACFQKTMYVAISTAISLLLLSVGSAMASGCETIAYDGADFTVCTVSGDDDVSLSLRDADGEILGTFDRLEEHVAAKNAVLVFAMNGGMYHPDRRPVGLYVEDGVQFAPLVTREGPGNFGLLPNGVLCIAEKRFDITESKAFASASPNCDFATQSGPLLVIDGLLHPRFLPNSDSRFFRNGVGVTDDGTLVAVISEDPVNFHHFGRLFRDVLKTPNALFLDGKVSRLFVPALGRHDFGFPMGPILSVTRPKD